MNGSPIYSSRSLKSVNDKFEGLSIGYYYFALYTVSECSKCVYSHLISNNNPLLLYIISRAEYYNERVN